MNIPRRAHLTCLALVAVLAAASSPGAQECTPIPRGAVAWWPADGTMEDLIGGHDAQDRGWGSPVGFAPGRVGQAFDFLDPLGLGQDNALVVQHHADLNFGPAGEYAIVLWLETPPTRYPSGQLALVSKWRGFSQPYPYEILMHADQFGGPNGRALATCGDEAVRPGVWTSSTVDDETFHQLATVFRHPDKTIDAYLDGRLNASNTYTEPPATLANTNDLYFGLRANPVNPITATDYNGLLDEIMIFDRALSACEIQQLHEAGGAGVCRDDADTDGLPEYEDNCPRVSNPEQTDSDGDGAGNDCDCAPLNPSHSVEPPEVCALTVEREGTVSKLGWTSVNAISGDGTRYDVLRGFLDEFPVGVGTSEQCLDNDFDGSAADDPFVPAPGRGVWYLVRAVSQCGVSSWGSTSSGVERASGVCP